MENNYHAENLFIHFFKISFLRDNLITAKAKINLDLLINYDINQASAGYKLLLLKLDIIKISTAIFYYIN